MSRLNVRRVEVVTRWKRIAGSAGEPGCRIGEQSAVALHQLSHSDHGQYAPTAIRPSQPGDHHAGVRLSGTLPGVMCWWAASGVNREMK